MSPPPTKAASCTGKEAFVSRRIADIAAKRLNKKGPAMVYRCVHCGKYHVGRPITPKRRTEGNPYAWRNDA